MLDDHQGLFAQGQAIEDAQRPAQGRLVLVRRVQKEQVVIGKSRPVCSKPLRHFRTEDVPVLGKPGQAQIFGHDRSTGSLQVHKRGTRGAARQCLDAKGAGTGEQVEDACTAYAVADDVEERLPHQGRGRPGCFARSCLERASAGDAGRDAGHDDE